MSDSDAVPHGLPARPLRYITSDSDALPHGLPARPLRYIDHFKEPQYDQSISPVVAAGLIARLAYHRDTAPFYLLTQGDDAIMSSFYYLTFAPGSAGKSYYAEKYTHPGHAIIDGDKLIAATIGWPDAPRWWEIPSIAEPQHKRGLAVVTRVAALMQDAQSAVEIVWNTSPATVSFAALKDTRIRVVLPPWREITRNIEAKRAEQAQGRKLGQPTDEPTVKNNWEAWRDWANQNRVPTFPRFKNWS